MLLGLISVGRERSARDPTARLDSAVELAADLDTPARLADALLWRSREHRIHGDPDRAIADLDRALALEPLDAGQREWFQLSLASAYWEAGQRDEARSLHAAVIKSAKRTENQRVLVTALGDAAWLDLLSGDDVAALQRVNEAYDLATRLDIPSMILGSAHTLALTQLCRGDPQAAAASLGRCVPVLRDYHERFRPEAYLHLGAAIAAGLTEPQTFQPYSAQRRPSTSTRPSSSAASATPTSSKTHKPRLRPRPGTRTSRPARPPLTTRRSTSSRASPSETEPPEGMSCMRWPDSSAPVGRGPADGGPQCAAAVSSVG